MQAYAIEENYIVIKSTLIHFYIAPLHQLKQQGVGIWSTTQRRCECKMLSNILAIMV